MMSGLTSLRYQQLDDLVEAYHWTMVLRFTVTLIEKDLGENQTGAFLWEPGLSRGG